MVIADSTTSPVNPGTITPSARSNAARSSFGMYRTSGIAAAAATQKINR